MTLHGWDWYLTWALQDINWATWGRRQCLRQRKHQLGPEAPRKDFLQQDSCGSLRRVSEAWNHLCKEFYLPSDSFGGQSFNGILTEVQFCPVPKDKKLLSCTISQLKAIDLKLQNCTILHFPSPPLQNTAWQLFSSKFPTSLVPVNSAKKKCLRFQKPPILVKASSLAPWFYIAWSYTIQRPSAKGGWVVNQRFSFRTKWDGRAIWASPNTAAQTVEL